LNREVFGLTEIAEGTHFFGIKLELAFLLQPVIQGGLESAEGQFALLFEQSVGDFLLLLVEVGGIRLLPVDNLVDSSVGAEVEGRTNLTNFKCERGGELFAAA
jgi:hypothetical protein